MIDCRCRGERRGEWTPFLTAGPGAEHAFVEIHRRVTPNVRVFKRVYRTIEHTTACVESVLGPLSCPATDKDAPSREGAS
jgi:hypothetical protein